MGRRIACVTAFCACSVLAAAGFRADAAFASTAYYIVRSGDTLWGIASRLRVTVGQLAGANHLALTSVLHPGERLVVPGTMPPAASARAESAARPASHPAEEAARGSGQPVLSSYVVRPGDTLWGIAARAGTPVSVLAASNHLSPAAMLHPGQRLVVPSAPAPAASSPEAARPAPPAPAPLGRAAARPVPPAATRGAPLRAAVPVRTSLPSRGIRFTSALVHDALRFLGRPYQWAGIGHRGFDCSGLVYRVFSAMGIAVPHSSFAQFRFGFAVPAWALAPGDLVFFHTYAWGASHVGIYLGAGRFIHASASRGVIVSSLAEPYYRYRYLGARRY